ncbi:rhodanese-like domain-containing protein [Lacimicrobium sp. SS2-24]|uniref:rhodanese-like domain-containing protein n=1 Tax=Lacimicrobium sp. SS2-24 TaxID=2005569 RepID=UPI000B4B91E6|nr:rhodanese-like domain-containing protein [Lacimicrobium sp. SS2-24]
MKFLLASVALLLASMGVVVAAEPISAQQVQQNAQDYFVLDVRSEEEYHQGHVPGATNIAHSKIDSHAGLLPADPTTPMVLYCRSGRRAALAAQKLEEMGYTKVFLMQGDMLGWQEQGFDVAYD